jgi:ribosomal protein L37AE/L43A/transposase-like protein
MGVEDSMASYDIQFQKGLSLREFNAAYATEEQCREAICKARWGEGFLCPECGSSRHCRLARGLFQCQDCRHQTSPTSGTIFQDTKLPLTVWFQAIHLLTQGKHSVSALELKRQLGVHYETAWSMKQKLLLVMAEREEDRRLTGRVEVDDAYDGGERHEGKRGRGAEGKTPFVVAVQTDVENPDQVLFLKMKTLKAVSTKELKPWFEEYIEPGTLILTDGWKAYNFLEEDYEHNAQKSPGGWKSAKVPAFRWVNTVLGNLKGNIKGVTRWVSRGHLDRYLAEFCYRFNRRFDLKSILPRLLAAAVSTPAMPQRLLKRAWMSAVA